MSETGTFTLSHPEPDLAVLTLDMPGKGANILSRSVLTELSGHLDELEKRSDLAGLILISGKPGIFIAGADLREFVASMDTITPELTYEMCRRGQDLFARLSKCPFVTVAAIDGNCVGGGAELACWCDRRIATNNSKTQIGFPEVQLGIFPGWGGTARAPRIVGLSNSVELITGGQSIGADEAYEMGLVSDVVDVDNLMQAAVNLVRSEQKTKQFEKDRAKWSGPISISETELGFLGATASAMIQQQTKGQYPAPVAALETMLGAAYENVDTACEMEAKGMSNLFGSPINASLLNVFFLTDRNKRDAGVADRSIEPEKIETAAVIGAGIMGAGIASANVKRGIPVNITDADRSALARGVGNVLEEVAYNKKTKGIDADKAVEFAPMVNGTSSDSELANCDLVVEAVVENLEVKKKIYGRLEPQLKESAILASNTSTIPITSLAEGLKRPDRFCGIHFFNPVRRMKLVEVIRGRDTSDQTVSTAVAYAKQLGKFPIVCNDGPGFLVNRLLFPYMSESLELLAEGVPIKAIDNASKKFGMPMGPIALYDMVGLDTSMYAGRTMWEAFPNRVKASPILPALVKAGRLGQKSGLGFFSYENRKKKAQPDPAIDKIIEPYIQGAADIDQETITWRLFLPMFLEGTRVLQEKIVRNAHDIDLGLIFGIGFPPFKGGLMFWADTVGSATLLEKLKAFESFGERMEPTPLLKELAASNGKFYDIE